MPLSTTRYPVPHVDSARGQGSDRDPRLNPQVYRLLRCRQFAQRQIHICHLSHLQCGHVRGVSQAVVATSLARQNDGGDFGQCPLSPCQTTHSPVGKASSTPGVTVPTAIQPPTGADRARLEVGASIGHTQPVLRQSPRCASRHHLVLRSVATTQCCVAKTMRQYLSRHV